MPALRLLTCPRSMAPFPEGSPQRQAVQQMQAAFEALWQQLMAPFSF